MPINDPQGRQPFVVDHLNDMGLEVPPQLSAAIGRFQPHGKCQTAIEIESSKIGLRQIDQLITMGFHGVAQRPQGDGFAHARFRREQTDAGALQRPLEALFERRQRTVIPERRRILAQRPMGQTKML